METLIIDKMSTFELKAARIPMESPVGVIEGVTMELGHRGDRFHRIELSDDWLNIKTGDVVRIKFDKSL